MSAKVEQCCRGGAVFHRGKGRCKADQGGQTMEAKLTELTREDEVYELDGEEIPVFEFDPDLIGFNCVSMIDCMTSTDSCGNQLPPSTVGVTHVLVKDPACDPGRVLLALSSGGELDRKSVV